MQEKLVEVSEDEFRGLSKVWRDFEGMVLAKDGGENSEQPKETKADKVSLQCKKVYE